MTLFQILGFFALATLISVSLASLIRYGMRARASLFWLLLWIIAAAALAKPRLAVLAARAVGVGRGADLVFYF